MSSVEFVFLEYFLRPYDLSAVTRLVGCSDVAASVSVSATRRARVCCSE